MSLGLCSGCARFARGSVCPFCGASVSAPRARTRARATRAGIVAATAAILACGGTVGGDDAGAKDSSVSQDGSGPRDASQDAVVAAYGLPPDAQAPPYGIPPNDE